MVAALHDANQVKRILEQGLGWHAGFEIQNPSVTAQRDLVKMFTTHTELTYSQHERAPHITTNHTSDLATAHARGHELHSPRRRPSRAGWRRCASRRALRSSARWRRARPSGGATMRGGRR